jgi:hypothetical protein
LVGACLVLLSASTARASAISCGFGGSTTDGPGCTPVADVFGQFNFGPYAVNLLFENVGGPFDVTITDAFTSQSELDDAGRLAHFPGFQCIPLDGAHCVDFEVSAPAPGPNTWTGFYTLTISWLLDTESEFPGNSVRILHNRGDVPGNGFDTDITVIGSYFGRLGCTFNCEADPGLSGRDDNFQSFLVVGAPVPEPGTWMLVGSGVAAWFARRRRLL